MVDGDQWSELAELLANLMEKHASHLDIDNIPNTEIGNGTESKKNTIEQE